MQIGTGEPEKHSERRFGNYLHNKNRAEYILSSKVGKLLKASQPASGKSYFPFSPSPNDVVFDYTADGVRRSVEDSLQRLGVSHLDILFVMTSRPITSYCRRRGRNSSILHSTAHFRPWAASKRRESSRVGALE